MRILIKNGYIVSMASPVLKGDLLIEDDKISRIGIMDCEADKVIDATGKVVMPGLINAHTHVAMSLFRGYADEHELMQWLSQDIWPVEDKMRAGDVYCGSILSGIEMLKSGTTTFNDMYFGEAFCAALPGFESLYGEILDYAYRELKDDSGLGIAICDEAKVEFERTEPIVLQIRRHFNPALSVAVVDQTGESAV